MYTYFIGERGLYSAPKITKWGPWNHYIEPVSCDKWKCVYAQGEFFYYLRYVCIFKVTKAAPSKASKGPSLFGGDGPDGDDDDEDDDLFGAGTPKVVLDYARISSSYTLVTKIYSSIKNCAHRGECMNRNREENMY